MFQDAEKEIESLKESRDAVENEKGILLIQVSQLEAEVERKRAAITEV